MVLARIGCHRAPFGSFPRVGKNTPARPRCGQKNSRATRCSQKPTNSRITRAAPVPPGCQRTSDITPQVPSCRPREEAISLAQQEVPPSSQARRGPGAAMVLSRIGCHRAPFGSFPRVGKNNPHARATGKSPSRHQAQPKAHHFARNEGGPLVPPGRQRTTDITPKAVPSRPREEAISLAQHEVPPPKPSGEGAGGSHGAVSDWLPPVALWFFPASGKEQPPTSTDVQRIPAPSGTAKGPPTRAQRGRPLCRPVASRQRA